MTPNEIEILIHYYVCGTEHPRASAPSVQKATERFIREGLIKYAENDTFIITERGSAHIRKLCNLELPGWYVRDNRR